MVDKIKPTLIITLTLIMVASASVLTVVQQQTVPKIEEHAQKRKENAILTVLPDADEYEQINKGDITLYKGLGSGGNVVGYAVQNSGQGYQSIIKIMVGLDMNQDKVKRINILSQAETPGLGARITNDQFKSQFYGKSFNDSYQAKKDVDAISGATISSQDVADVVKGAINKVQEIESEL